MKLVLQRVARASVKVDDVVISEISTGLLILFGAEKGDCEGVIDFPDEKGKMNLSCRDIGGEILVVSQFTLAGDCAKGRRPSFDKAAKPEEAERLYRGFVDALTQAGLPVREGRFGADMQVELVNSGPVTFILER